MIKTKIMKTIIFSFLMLLFTSCCQQPEQQKENIFTSLDGFWFPIIYENNNWVVCMEQWGYGFRVLVFNRHWHIPCEPYWSHHQQDYRGGFNEHALDSMRNNAIEFIEQKKRKQSRENKINEDIKQASLKY